MASGVCVDPLVSRRSRFCLSLVGMGAALSIFTIADHLLLRPLQYRHPDRLVMLWETSPADRHNVVSPANYLDWKVPKQVL